MAGARDLTLAGDRAGGPDAGRERRAAAGRIGMRVATARHAAGMTEKQLAARLGLPLWRIDRIEKGGEDPRPHLAAIAASTGKPERWFLAGERTRSAPAAEKLEEEPSREPGQTGLLRRASRELTTRMLRLTGAERTTGADEVEPADANGHAGPATAARIVSARHEAELSQKELAAICGVPLWRMERIERGEDDPTGYLRTIAARTDRDLEWFRAPESGQATEPAAADSAPAEPAEPKSVRQELLPPPLRRNVVLGSLVLLVTIRLFTEVLHLLPRALKLVDIPVLATLLIAAAVIPRRDSGRNTTRYLVPAGLFLLVGLVSIMANLDRVEPGPAILFLYGFLAPVAVFVAVYQLWPTGSSLTMSRLLVALVALQFVVVVLIDLPQFVASGGHNPDIISGTFGQNPYQLIFFLLLSAATLAGIYTFEPKRLAARLAPLFFVATLVTIFLAQYRALLFTMAATAVLVAILLGFIRLRGAVVSLIVAVTFALTFSYVSTLYPTLKYAGTVATLTSDPGLYVSKRLEVIGEVGRLYNDDPRFMVTGTGPGTYSSRAWYTFAQDPSRAALSTKNRRGEGGLTGYQTDVSRKYVLPKIEGGEAIQGSRSLTSPLSSYASLLAEVGIFGFGAMVFIYGGAFLLALRMTRQTLRRPRKNDPLPGLLLGCTAGFFVLLQMGMLENWFEVTRLTFILWIVMAVATKEFTGRRAADRSAPAAAAH